MDFISIHNEPIGLIDVDAGKNFPNLVLLKLSSYFKQNGCSVDLLDVSDVLGGMIDLSAYSHMFGACVFTRNQETCTKLQALGVFVAGSGAPKPFDSVTLPPEIEHIYPDYTLYHNDKFKNTAYGFMSRGCPRGCPFCIVAGKEGRQSRKVADLSEFRSKEHYLKLMDPNILACPDSLDLLQQLVDTRVRVDINQGLDARLLNPENIALINSLNTEMLHFAWDNPRDTKCRDNLALFAESNPLKPRRRRVYVLTNYWSTFDQDLMRVYWLRDNGYDPYVMVYDREHAPKQIKRLQRYVNNKFVFRTCPSFDDYQKK